MGNSLSLYTQDKLEFIEKQTKSDRVLTAISNLQAKNLVYRPSLLSFHMFFGGHVQTLASDVMEAISKSEINYDKRESFILSDGGTIYIDYMGESFKDKETETSNDENSLTSAAAPVMFVCPGLTSSS